MNNLAVSPRPAPEPVPGRGLIVAVLDDSLIDRYLICHVLREIFDDSVTLEFATAGEARRYLADSNVDILLADRILPDGDGADFALAPPAGAAVVLLSGEDCPDVTARLEAEGRVRFLHKDDLNGEKLAEALLPLVRKRAEVVPLRPGATPPAPAEAESDISPIVRGLRLIRTVRARKDRTGSAEIAELLNQIEEVLLTLKRRSG